MENYFETIKCENYDVFNLHYHNKRVSQTIAKNIDLNEYIYPLSKELLKCKVIYNEVEIKEVTYSKYVKRDIHSFQLVYSDEVEYLKKNVNRREIDNLFNRRKDSDEIIIVKDGLITDTSIANIAIFDGTNWLTPKKPLLYGTTRDRLLEEKHIIQTDISVEILLSAKKIALLNSMIGMDIKKSYSFVL